MNAVQIPIRNSGWIFVLCALTPVFATEINLDRYHAISTDISETTILVETFTTEGADLGSGARKQKKKAYETAKIMKETAPRMYSEALRSRLTESGVFDTVIELTDDASRANALIIEGRFTKLSPGSRTKRWMVGMGAGKSKICIEGRLLNAAGEELATFEDCRSGVGAWSFAGGRAEGMMSNDIYQSAFGLADFVAIVARGEIAAGTIHP